jgi:catechol 2,3-dioxygenase-like lactoylglutathione lyase family enzyme
MTLHAFTHVALRVDHLREAEAYYCGLFGLEVAWRQAETPDGWYRLPQSAGWDDAERAGIDLSIVMLYRGGLRIALEAVESVAEDGRLAHVGIFADEDELEGLRETVADTGGDVVTDREQALIFDDRFGVRWEVNSFAYDNPPTMSTGARAGKWLELEHRRGAGRK